MRSLFLTCKVEPIRTSHLYVPDLKWSGCTLWADDVVLSCLSHLSLQGLKLTINVRKPCPSRSAALHLKPDDTN